VAKLVLHGLDEACQTDPGRAAARAMLAWAILEAVPVVVEVAPALAARLGETAASGAALATELVEAELAAVDDHIDDTQVFADLQRDLRAMVATAAELPVRCAGAVDRAIAAILERALTAVALQTGASADAEARGFFAREIGHGVLARWQALVT